MDTQQAIDEAKPMLDDVLGRIGLHRSGDPLDFARLREPFSSWLQAQVVPEEDLFFLTAVVGAFISEYLIQCNAAERYVENGHIRIRVPLQHGVAREFDPYATAMGAIKTQSSLGELLATVGT